MSKNKLYLFLIAGLLLSNILMGYFLLVGKCHNRPKPREIIIERLKFDKNQIAQYDKMIQRHQKQIMQKQENMLKLKKELYLCLKDTGNWASSDTLAKKIGKIQEEIELIHYSHFEEIKKLCNKNQINSFNELIKELAGLLSPVTMKENEGK
jgi:protein CpxP